mmetsp:Transcript_18681/g.46507  ORF Transcript_18681/g.46507 Transcript_18681/m.46507 type:complete len:595 (-) Transcript_18681:65-1849(-)
MGLPSLSSSYCSVTSGRCSVGGRGMRACLLMATVALPTSSARTYLRSRTKSDGSAMVPPGSVVGFSPITCDTPWTPMVDSCMGVPSVASAVTVRCSTCVPRFLGSYRTTMLADCPGGILPVAGVGLKNVDRAMLKSTGKSLLTFFTVRRWSATSLHATGPKSRICGSMARHPTVDMAVMGIRSRFFSPRKDTTPRNWWFLDCLSTLGSWDLNPLVGASMRGLSVKVMRVLLYGASVPSLGSYTSVSSCFSLLSDLSRDAMEKALMAAGESSSSSPPAIAAARFFSALALTENLTGVGPLLYTTHVRFMVSPKNTVPNGISVSGPPPGSSLRSSSDCGTTAALRSNGTGLAMPSTLTSTVVFITPTSGGAHVTVICVTPPSGPCAGPTSPNGGSIFSALPNDLSQSTLKVAGLGPLLQTLSLVVTELPCTMTPISSEPVTLTSLVGACAARGSSVWPLSVWIRMRSKKLSSASVAKATSKVVVMPGASLTVVDSCAVRWNFLVTGLMIFTVCRWLSALRSVTTQLYTVLGSILVNATAGGNTRSHGLPPPPPAPVIAPTLAPELALTPPAVIDIGMMLAARCSLQLCVIPASNVF